MIEKWQAGSVVRKAKRRAGEQLARAILRRTGGPYLNALDLGRGRFQVTMHEQGGDHPAYLLADLPQHAPAIAVAAFDGCQLSPDPELRRSAAGALPLLYEKFPSEALRILTNLEGDEDPRVRDIASSSRELVDSGPQ